MRNLFIAGTVVLVLAGCASSGTLVRPAQMADLKKGETTKEQVVATLGHPSSVVRQADGKTILIYSHADFKYRPSTFIPIVGLFAGGADVTTNVARLSFDERGKLVDYTTTESASGTGYGLSSGTAQ